MYLFSSELGVLPTPEDNEKEEERLQAELDANPNGEREKLEEEKLNQRLDEILQQENIVKKVNELKNAIGESLNEKSKIQNELGWLKRKISELQSAQKELSAMQAGLRVELIYQIANQVFVLRIDEGQQGAQCRLELIESNLPKTASDIDTKLLNSGSYQKKLGEAFFYNVSVNYSHYSLNASKMGGWINLLFHKNDGYKTPLVINPMRTNGNFKINDEILRAKYRLLSNLMIERKISKEKQIYLTEKQYVSKIRFTLIKDKVGEESIKRGSNITSGTSDLDIITNNVFAELGIEDQKILMSNQHPFQSEMDKYAIKKVKKIADQYDEYKGFRKSNNTPSEVDYDQITKNLLEEESHVAFKLKQLVNFFRYSSLDSKENAFKQRNALDQYDFTLEDLVKWAKDATTENMVMHLPPSFFDIEIYLQEKDAESESPFSSLSSGEQQLIHASQSVIYHINNINSVTGSRFDRVKYRNINIIYDEIELYFHPEYQRQFISRIIRSLKSVHLGKKSHINAINFLFLTHSPFILSDIPSSNILFLQSDAVPETDISAFKTFGANIHDLLQLSFFLKDGSMGEFARHKINETISFINYKRLNNELLNFKEELSIDEKDLKDNIKEQLSILSRNSINLDLSFHRALVSQIDEPLLRTKLQEMLGEIDNQYRIDELSKKIEQLEKEKLTLEKNA
ncbi:hypothetical protein [Pedobacter rhizosphaerae]|uniref:hypothetical protein n=1 Tax=Pedobacter rhizosphaerae TaxID=390241 RepID=UPI0015871CB0|nr:hypothetical protein [Pedobacter rhizosphaerae]